MTLPFLIQASHLVFPSVLAAGQSQLKERTRRLLSNVHNWYAMSNHSAGDDGTATSSLEAIHDTVHGTIGGHMGDPAVAGMLFCDVEFLGNA
jgi:hypothetical protein